jgi:hypothetical protein
MRTEWQQQQTWHGESAGGSVAVYGWMAAQEDLRGDDTVGMFLRATAVVARSTEDAVMEARCEQAATAVKSIPISIPISVVIRRKYTDSNVECV